MSFDGYDGPSLDDDDPIVPVLRSRREFYRGAMRCARTQFPVTTAFAITVHKSQGITVDRAVLDISTRDFVTGLSYVAVSRVKKLAGVLFERPFDFERFKMSRESQTMKARNDDRERRLPQHMMVPELAIHSSSPVRGSQP